MRGENEQEQAKRLADIPPMKKQIWPQKGTGGGCMAPWDMEGIINRAVKSQKGRVEFAWHWQNLDWTTLYTDHFHKDFKGFSEDRYWIYEFDANLPEHHYCRVTYRKDLLQPQPDSREPEFLPCQPNEQVCAFPSS